MKRTGVIVPVQEDITAGGADKIRRELEGLFPGVTFAIVAGGTGSAVFEYERRVEASPMERQYPTQPPGRRP